MHIHTIQLNIEKMLGGCAGMDATEFGAYMSLIVTCYQTNNTLPDDDARLARMARTSLKVWKRIRPVIAVKFMIIDGKWSHDVIRKELVKYHSLSTKNRANALKGHKTEKPVASQSPCDRTANTSNKDQVTSKSKKGYSPKNISKDVWDDFKKLRKAKKAPITETAIKRIEGQAQKIGWTLEQALIECCNRGWTGFNHEWVLNSKGNQNGKSKGNADNELQEYLDR